ncbi:MAG: response regulator transcription factor [Chloroflexi bacterium]|nr:response regulator transcription factor [Chloroflexota bacterium]
MTDILLIDDDQGLTQLLGDYLISQGFATRTAGDGHEGMHLLFDRKPDLILLDVTMPNRDGFETLARIRELSDVPVIMLTARGEESYVLRGFSFGADDYVVKPFSFAQLIARIRAVLGRGSKGARDDVLSKADLEVDLKSKRVTRSGQPLTLTPTEFKLLTAIMRRAGEVVSLEELVREVWGPQYSGEIGYVRRYIWHLRQKIEPDPEHPRYLYNERGYGYRFQA